MPATTVPDLLDRRAADASDQDIAFPDGRLTYPDLAAATGRLIGPLWAAGIRPGDHVGILLPNRIESVTTWLAVAQLGAVAVPVNPRLKAGELAYIIENADLRHWQRTRCGRWISSRTPCSTVDGYAR